MCLKPKNQFYLTQEPGKIYNGRIIKDLDKRGNIAEIELIYHNKSTF